MKKVTLTQVKAKIKKEGFWKGYICPSKCKPNIGHPFNMAMEVNFDTGIHYMEKVINEFSYYNCNNETGKNIHYYEIVS